MDVNQHQLIIFSSFADFFLPHPNGKNCIKENKKLSALLNI